MLLVPSKGEVILAGGCRGINEHLGVGWQKPTKYPSLQTLDPHSPPYSPPSLAPTYSGPCITPHPLWVHDRNLVILALKGARGAQGRGPTFTVPKSSSLMWPPPNSFFTVARVAAYSIFSRT